MRSTQTGSGEDRIGPRTAFYDPARSYEENYEHGPFGDLPEPHQPKPPTSPELPEASAGASLRPRAAAPEPDAPEPDAPEPDAPEPDAPEHKPAHRFLGQPVGLPFGIAAGPLLNSRFIRAALDAGFDLPVYKTVRTRRWAAHPWPNVLAVEVEGDLHPTAGRLRGHTDYTAPLSVTNSFGVPSFDPAVWQPDLAHAVQLAGPGQVVIGSFQGTPGERGDVEEYVADFVQAARLVRETGAKILEVNLSCPNEGTAHLLCFDTDRATRVIEAIKNEIGDVPLIAKIAYFPDQTALRRLVEGIGGVADGIAAINTIGAEIVNEAGEQALPGEGRLRSGVGGHAIRWAGLATVEHLARLREELGLHFSIVGIGGVSEPTHYAAYRVAGADAAMSATAAMWNAGLAGQIKQQLGELAHAG